MGGDEFAVLMESDEDPSEKVQKRLETISDPTLRFLLVYIPSPLISFMKRQGIIIERGCIFPIVYIQYLVKKYSLQTILMYEAKRQAKVKSGGLCETNCNTKQTEYISIEDASE